MSSLNLIILQTNRRNTMQTFTIQRNNCLTKNIKGFYGVDYTGWRAIGNPDYLNILKNDFTSYSRRELIAAKSELEEILLQDLPLVASEVEKSNLTVCVVPRSKAKITYSSNQLLFLESIKEVVRAIDTLKDGTEYITRVKDTQTTHLARVGYGGRGSLPYKGISKDSCHFSKSIIGKNILLIDDIYTKTVDIDEDMMQALLDAGAKSVVFYAVAKTIYKGN